MSLRKGYMTASSIEATLPLCSRHKLHLEFSWLLRVFWIAGIVAFSLIGLILLIVVLNKPHLDEILIFCGLIAVSLIWAFGLRALVTRMIFPTDFRDDSITYTGVSKQFLSAYDQHQSNSQ